MRAPRLSAAALAAVLAVTGLSGCARATTDGGIAVAGDTRVDLVTVAAPRLTTPTVDVAVGISPQATADGGADVSAAISKAAAAKARAGAQPRGGGVRRAMPAGRLTTVTVVPGSVVRKGEVVAQFDTALLALGVENARAAYRRQLAQANALSSSASDLRDQRATVIDAQAQLRDSLAQAEAGLPQLRSGIAGLEARIASDRTALAALQQQLAATPPGPAHDAIAGQVAGLRQKIAGEQAALAKLRAQLAQLEAAIPKLEQGIAQTRSARSRIADAISQLEAGSDIALAYAGVGAVAVDTAEAALAQATLRSPCDGVVVRAMHAGEVAMAGAPVLVIRPTGATLVDTYLTSEQLAQVSTGTAADVSLDSLPGVLRGSVLAISAEEQFPPSNFPTQFVHLAHVVRVTVSVPETLPLGVPADVVIRPQ